LYYNEELTLGSINKKNTMNANLRLSNGHILASVSGSEDNEALLGVWVVLNENRGLWAEVLLLNLCWFMTSEP
jgi:hypothetical protein